MTAVGFDPQPGDIAWIRVRGSMPGMGGFSMARLVSRHDAESWDVDLQCSIHSPVLRMVADVDVLPHEAVCDDDESEE